MSKAGSNEQYVYERKIGTRFLGRLIGREIGMARNLGIG